MRVKDQFIEELEQLQDDFRETHSRLPNLIEEQDLREKAYQRCRELILEWADLERKRRQEDSNV